MKELFGFLMMGIIGFMIVIIGSSGLLGIIGIMLGFFGGILMLMPNLMLFGTVFKEGLYPYFKKLKKGEDLAEIQTRDGDTFLMTVENKHEGVLYSKGKFFSDRRGTPYRTPSGKRKHFVLGGIGFSQTPKANAYFSILKKEKKVPSYEDAIKRYLGQNKYEAFKQKFRDQKVVLDRFSIGAELNYLLDVKDPADALKAEINGETYDFRDALSYMVYAYDTSATENAIEREKLDILMRQHDYAQAQKAIGYAIAIVIVIIGVGIGFYLIQNINFSGFLGGMFGGGP